MSEANGIAVQENGMVTFRMHTRCTDPETIRLIGEQALAVMENTVDPKPEFVEVKRVEVEEKKEPAQPQVRPPHARVHARVWAWLIVQVATPYRVKRAAMWSLRFPPRAWSFLRVVTGPKESVYEKSERDEVCAECPFRVYRMRRTKTGVVMDEHCGKCGCPDWYFSRNEVRNAYSKWSCPERKHAGPYPDDDLREHLKEHGYDPKTVFGGGGCTGCGCGKAAK